PALRSLLSMPAALRAIAVYSLTGTGVVFDRIRENMKVRHKEPLETVMNASINGVLPRTVITSLTTLCAALALLIFGGEVIHDFALAMTMGIIIGTYSSPKSNLQIC
ncbi:preprotein translocase subunit SecF, partial [Candidatus Hakubella thermalkaliphila]